MPGPLLAYCPALPTALVILCQQLVTRSTVTPQLRQRARLALLWHVPTYLPRLERRRLRWVGTGTESAAVTGGSNGL
jgi:hypothetical protein